MILHAPAGDITLHQLDPVLRLFFHILLGQPERRPHRGQTQHQPQRRDGHQDKAGLEQHPARRIPTADHRGDRAVVGHRRLPGLVVIGHPVRLDGLGIDSHHDGIGADVVGGHHRPLAIPRPDGVLPGGCTQVYHRVALALNNPRSVDADDQGGIDVKWEGEEGLVAELELRRHLVVEGLVADVD